MPIPSQNEFLLPFLTILSDGQSYTRSQLMYRLAKQFDISEDEAQDMSGNQFTLVSRLAWCDVHFCKAGLVEKRQHHDDSFQDEFRITPLGIRELNRRPDQLTVGYLQSFYRGKVHRGAGSDDTPNAKQSEQLGTAAYSPLFLILCEPSELASCLARFVNRFRQANSESNTVLTEFPTRLA
jgi:restriction endonuclease Mrr